MEDKSQPMQQVIQFALNQLLLVNVEELVSLPCLSFALHNEFRLCERCLTDCPEN